MKSSNEINKQLWGLVRGIKQCNFIPLEDREDIVQDSHLKIIEKINEGRLKDEFQEIKGYTFFILKNFCLQYHREKDKKGQKYQYREDITHDDINSIESKEIYRKILSNLVLNKTYSNDQRTYVQMCISGYTTEQIQNSMEITNEELGHLKRSITMKTRFQLKRTPKFYIKKISDLNIQIPCYTINDVKLLFSELTAKQIYNFIDKKRKIGEYYIIRA